MPAVNQEREIEPASGDDSDSSDDSSDSDSSGSDEEFDRDGFEKNSKPAPPQKQPQRVGGHARSSSDDLVRYSARSLVFIFQFSPNSIIDGDEHHDVLYKSNPNPRAF